MSRWKPSPWPIMTSSPLLRRCRYSWLMVGTTDTIGSVERARVALDGNQWFALFRDPAGVLFGLWTANPER